MTQKYLLVAVILVAISTSYIIVHEKESQIRQLEIKLSRNSESQSQTIEKRNDIPKIMEEDKEPVVATGNDRQSSLINMIKANKGEVASVKKQDVPDSNAALVSERLVYGSLDAQYTITAYSDIECPICKRIHPHIKAVVDYAPSVVNWEYKHYPLSQHNPAAAVQSAMVNCALEEKGNRFAWFLLDEFVKHTGSKGRGQGDFVAFSEHVGVAPSWLEQCVHEDINQSAVANDYQEGISLGIKDTPVLIIKNNVTGNVRRIHGFHTAEQIAQSLSAIR